MTLNLPSDLAKAAERAATEKGHSVSDWILKLVRENIPDDEDLGDAKADKFFGAREVRRLDELMKKWRKCRDEDLEMDPSDQAELDSLVDLEFDASGKRAMAAASK